MYAHQSISSVHRLGSKLFDRASDVTNKKEINLTTDIQLDDDNTRHAN